MIVKLLLISAWIEIMIGLIGIWRFDNIYARMLTSSKIDTVATLTIIIALIIESWNTAMTPKLVVILVLLMITSPITNHVITRSAYLNGIPLKKEGSDEI